MNYIIRFAIALLTLLLLSCTNSNKTALSQPKNDSIKKYLELASNDTLSFPDRNKYNKKAFSFIDLSKNDTLTRYYLSIIGITYNKLNKIKELKVTTDILYKKSIQKKDSNKIAASFRLFDKYYALSSKNDSALYYCFKAKKYYEKTKDYNNLSLIYCDLCSIQTYECDFLGSNKTAFEGLKIAQNANRIRFLRELIAVNLAYLNDYDNSNKYYLSVLNLIDKNKNLQNYRFCIWGDIGDNYLEQKKIIKAIYYFKKVLSSKLAKTQKPTDYAYCLDRYAFCKLKIKDFEGLPKLFFDSEKIRDKNYIENGRNYNKIYLSEYYAFKNDTTKAIKYAKEAVKISKTFKNPNDVLCSIKQLLKVDKFNAFKNSQDYININDSLKLAERRFRDKFARIAYETDEITQEKETAIIQKWVITSMMSGILLIVILLFVIFYQKSKQKEVNLLQAQQKANEETYQMFLNQQALQDEAKTVEKKRIALELHDNILNKLASIRFNLYPITQKNDPEIQKNAEKHVNRIKDVEDEIRTISHDFSNDLFAEAYSFKIILEKLIDEQNKLYPDTQYRLELEEKINLDSISSKIKMNMYRIIQEALYNVHKHAKATKVALAIIQDENNICISILDNGIGFDTSKTKEGIGIKNIKLRIKQLSGKISVISSTKHGTAINMAIPIVTINK